MGALQHIYSRDRLLSSITRRQENGVQSGPNSFTFSARAGSVLRWQLVPQEMLIKIAIFFLTTARLGLLKHSSIKLEESGFLIIRR